MSTPTPTPTGVFVRLPLSEDQKQAMYDYVSGDVSMEEVFLAIGTPVTGDDVQVVGWCHPEQLADLHIDNDSPDNERFVVMSRVRIGSRDVPLVRQSDHLAALASLQAEVGQLRAALLKSRDALVRVTDERSTSYQARNGKWVSIQGDDGERCDIIHSDITTDCYAAVEFANAALKGPEA